MPKKNVAKSSKTEDSIIYYSASLKYDGDPEIFTCRKKIPLNECVIKLSSLSFFSKFDDDAEPLEAIEITTKEVIFKSLGKTFWLESAKLEFKLSSDDADVFSMARVFGIEFLILNQSGAIVELFQSDVFSYSIYPCDVCRIK